MDLLVMAGQLQSADALRTDVGRWETLGVNGVLITDHLFAPGAPERRDAPPQIDPVAVLSAVGAMSGSLKLGTIVANVGLLHPALVLRHFNQLAVLFGGQRVLAGLGAGWNGEEFEALGQDMPPFATRMERLEETLRLARQLELDGYANLEGASFAARDLPRSPRPDVAPQLLVGGGSDQVLRLAGRYADRIDLNGSSRRLSLGRASPSRQDGVRRLTTTVDDLVRAVGIVEAAAVDAGRPAGAVRRSVLVDTVAFCSAAETEAAEEALCAGRGMAPAPLADRPYVLVGEPARMRDLLAARQEQIGLSAIIVPDGPNLGRFATEVVGTL
jgi:alkanesulfonate monooxygenase SsuD/methylene tetrahydromethanopterin reductase-like flavin-dependent oxidoreductase (luciferase family)